MPLVDQFGHPVSVPRPKKSKRPKNKPAPRRAPKGERAHILSIQPVRIVLRAQHTVNGEPYGPGPVVVKRELANALLEQDRRAAVGDANFAGTKACVVGPGRQKGALSVTEVAPEFFDSSALSVLPFGVVDRATAQFKPN